MPSRLIKSIARCLIACYILAGFLIEIGHRDVHELSTDRQPLLTTHACGAHEIHIPLDNRHECLACAQSTLRAGIVGIASTVDALQPLLVGDFCESARHFSSATSLSQDQRGPPHV
jgi:hypothetical protein